MTSSGNDDLAEAELSGTHVITVNIRSHIQWFTKGLVCINKLFSLPPHRRVEVPGV